MMSMRGFSRALDSGFASSDLSDLFVWGLDLSRAGRGPRFGTCLKSFVWERSRFGGAITDLEEQSGTLSPLSPVEGSLKLKSGAFFVPNNKSFIGWDGAQETSRASS